MRAPRLVCTLAALAAIAAPASAQVADSVAVVVTPGAEGRTVTVPLPEAAGEFYYRAGSVGPSRFRPQIPRPRMSRGGAPPSAAVAAARAELGLPPSPRPASARASVSGGVTRLDLLLLERDLLDAIDRRLARLAAGPTVTEGNAASPVVVLPGRRPETAPAGETSTPTPPAVVGPPGVETVERAVLETGLFRTTQVNFEFAQADLIPSSAATLDVVADVLRRYPALRVEVGGHTDDRGSEATNDRLSQRRAEAVVDYLAASGVGRDRLSAVGYSERRPVASNGTETGRALNRRVEFVVLGPRPAEPIRQPVAPGLRDVIREELDRLRDDGGG